MKFFHLSTLINRRRNKIERLRTNNGDWVSTKADLKKVEGFYFQDLFADNPQACIPIDWPNLFNDRSTELNDSRNAPIDEEEVKHAMFSIGPLKTPSKDGGLAMFYHKSWEF